MYMQVAGLRLDLASGHDQAWPGEFGITFGNNRCIQMGLAS